MTKRRKRKRRKRVKKYSKRKRKRNVTSQKISIRTQICPLLKTLQWIPSMSTKLLKPHQKWCPRKRRPKLILLRTHPRKRKLKNNKIISCIFQAWFFKNCAFLRFLLDLEFSSRCKTSALVDKYSRIRFFSLSISMVVIRIMQRPSATKQIPINNALAKSESLS